MPFIQPNDSLGYMALNAPPPVPATRNGGSIITRAFWQRGLVPPCVENRWRQGWTTLYAATLAVSAPRAPRRCPPAPFSPRRNPSCSTPPSDARPSGASGAAAEGPGRSAAHCSGSSTCAPDNAGSAPPPRSGPALPRLVEAPSSATWPRLWNHVAVPTLRPE